MGAAADTTLEVQDQPDSLEEPGQEPEEVEAVEPVEGDSDDAADSDELAAGADADSVGQPEDDGAAVDDRPRDEHGRFVSTKEAPPAGSPQAETSPPAAATAAPQGEPFRFRVDGMTVDVDGAYEHDGKITMSREAWDRVVQPRTADRGRTQHVQERMQTRIRTLEGEAEAREDRFKRVLAKVDELFSDPGRIAAFAQQYELQAPRFQAELRAELAEMEVKRHKEGAKTRDSEAEEREFSELAPRALENAVGMVVDQMAKDAGGTKVDRQAIAEELRGLWDSGVPLYFRVQEGDGSGLDPREHKWGVNLALVERITRPYVELQRKGAAQDKAAQVAAANAAALGKNAKPKAPPTAPASGSPTPGGEAKFPTTREEYEAYRARRSKELNLPM